jgi:hypothetical protein
MKKTLLILLSAICVHNTISAITTEQTQRLPESKYTIRVIDESGKPLEGTSVSFFYKDLTIPRSEEAKGTITNEQGVAIYEGESTQRIATTIDKVGYYRGWFPKHYFKEVKDGRWEPWNPTVTAVLRPIIKPIPMFVKKVITIVPVNDSPCGYDLTVGDWVAPWGKGTTADFIFNAHCEYTDFYNDKTTCTVTFSNPDDGLQEAVISDMGKTSGYKWDRNAPEHGYKSTLPISFVFSRKEGAVVSFSENRRHYFRVRTQKSANKVSHSLYGKIDRDISIFQTQAKKCQIAFIYYLNPTPNDRNMEYDPKKNLCTNQDTRTPPIFHP